MCTEKCWERWRKGGREGERERERRGMVVRLWQTQGRETNYKVTHTHTHTRRLSKMRGYLRSKRSPIPSVTSRPKWKSLSCNGGESVSKLGIREAGSR